MSILIVILLFIFKFLLKKKIYGIFVYIEKKNPQDSIPKIIKEKNIFLKLLFKKKNIEKIN